MTEEEDVVARLRSPVVATEGGIDVLSGEYWPDLIVEAANEIARLRGLVKDAYEEGISAGNGISQYWGPNGDEWEHSTVRDNLSVPSQNAT